MAVLLWATALKCKGARSYCTSDNKPGERIECGKYGDMLRTTEVFSEMTIIGWNFKDPEYVMPQN